MLNWIVSFLTAALFVGLGLLANSKLGTVRKDKRPHKLPWGLIMVGCVFGIFLVVVHVMNLVGVETGPEHGIFGRF